eukprot:1161512-Pelagomonas_calceolata.AAC.5
MGPTGPGSPSIIIPPPTKLPLPPTGRSDTSFVAAALCGTGCCWGGAPQDPSSAAGLWRPGLAACAAAVAAAAAVAWPAASAGLAAAAAAAAVAAALPALAAALPALAAVAAVAAAVVAAAAVSVAVRLVQPLPCAETTRPAQLRG